MLYRIKRYVSSFENTYLQRFKNKRDYLYEKRNLNTVSEELNKKY